MYIYVSDHIGSVEDTAKYAPVLCKVRIVIEQPARPPKIGLRNSIRLDGITPILRFLIHCYSPRRQSYSKQNDSLKHNHIIIYVPCLSSPFPISGEIPPMSPLLGKTLESAPTQREFLKIVINNLSDRWFLFGANLEIDVGKLNAVEIENEKKTKECFLKVFKIWKDFQHHTGLNLSQSTAKNQTSPPLQRQHW